MRQCWLNSQDFYHTEQTVGLFSLILNHENTFNEPRKITLAQLKGIRMKLGGKD